MQTMTSNLVHPPPNTIDVDNDDDNNSGDYVGDNLQALLLNDDSTAKVPVARPNECEGSFRRKAQDCAPCTWYGRKGIRDTAGTGFGLTLPHPPM